MQNENRVIALGFFDGVHLGHGALLRRVAETAARLHAIPTALTFDRHPKSFAGGKPVPLINTPQDRADLMRAQYGIEDVVVLPFDQNMMEMPWDRFVSEVLAERFRAIHVVAGHDYRFGYRGMGDPARLKALCAELGIGCDIIQRVELDGMTISSTHIRGLIEAGNMEEANRFLGHPHVLSGEVLHGRQLGRTIGIPTANLVIPPHIIVPAHGVYATRVVTSDGTYSAVTNVGVRPTLEDGRGVTVEPWILDFDGDLYGKRITIRFYQQLRGERKFASLEDLKREILQNGEQTRRYFQSI